MSMRELQQRESFIFRALRVIDLEKLLINYLNFRHVNDCLMVARVNKVMFSIVLCLHFNDAKSRNSLTLFKHGGSVVRRGNGKSIDFIGMDTSFSPLRNHGYGRYKVSCGPRSQYLPRLYPLIKTTPLVQPFMSRNVSISSLSILNVPLYSVGGEDLFHSVTLFHETWLPLNLTHK